ncbi:MAG: magnesium/cobalt transporter CorA [Nitrospirota bacterium]|nr:magnesium/cobalt transporter CorA [Nitrospirota bacterium]
MTRITKRRIKKVGLPSETLVYTGERPGGRVDVTLIDYDEQTFEERTIRSADECVPYRTKPTATWINVDGVHEAPMIERLGECFGLHKLVTEDLMSVVQRPKVEDFGDYLFIVLKMLTYDEKAKKVVPEQVSLIVGQSFLLSFQEGVQGDVFQLIRDRLRTGRGKIRKLGADYLAYSLLDALVDGYFLILEKLGDRIDALEDELMARPSRAIVEKLYHLKRELLFVHKAVWPLREVIARLQRRESALIRETTTPYLRDVYDHLAQVIDSVEIYREIMTEMLETYLSSVSNRLNEIMKVLTIIATIFMPLTFLAGVYGMNFKHMPELEWKYGYYLVWAVMAAVGGGMFLYFRRKKWM